MHSTNEIGKHVNLQVPTISIRKRKQNDDQDDIMRDANRS